MRQTIQFATQSLRIREFARSDLDALYALTRQSAITDILPEWKMGTEQLSGFLDFVVGSYVKFNPGPSNPLCSCGVKASLSSRIH